MTEASAQTKECPYCGETIKKNAQICIHCDKFLYTGRWQRFRWTGFRGKGLWDILSLIVIPLALVLISIWFSVFQANRQAEFEATRMKAQSTVEADRAQGALLEAYFDQMTELLLEEELRESDPGSEVRSIARARTLTVLRRLDPERKGALLRFLHESRLITTGTAVIDLSGADLSEADLSRADLSGADLAQANLSGADLAHANLSGADLTLASLGAAYLWNANLERADLRGAYLWNANLWEANLERAFLAEANLSLANLVGVSLHEANFDEWTILPDGTKWTPDTDMARFTDPDHPDFRRPEEPFF